MKLTSKESVTAHLNEYFDEEFQHWENHSREIWTYKSREGVGVYSSQENLNSSVVGAIGRPCVVEENLEENSITFTRTKLFRKKMHTSTVTVTKKGDSYSVVKFWSFLYETYLENMDKMRGNPSYEKAVSVTGWESPSDEEVALVMATTIYGIKKDVPDVATGLITLEVKTEEEDGKIRITGKFMIDGVETTPLKRMWWVNPSEGAIGTASSGKAAGEYIGSRSTFTVNTDFNDRDSFIIMNPKDVDVKFYCQYKEQDGDLKMFNKTITVDMSDVLPLFDYYGLA